MVDIIPHVTAAQLRAAQAELKITTKAAELAKYRTVIRSHIDSYASVLDVTETDVGQLIIGCRELAILDIRDELLADGFVVVGTVVSWNDE